MSHVGISNDVFSVFLREYVSAIVSTAMDIKPLLGLTFVVFDPFKVAK